MATWKAREKGFHGGRIREAGDVFEAPDGEDISWADPADGQRPTPAPAGPKADTLAGIQSGPKVLELTSKLEASEARVAELEAIHGDLSGQVIALKAKVNELESAQPTPADESDTVKSLRADLKAAQKRVIALEADAKTKDDLLAAKDQEYQEMMKNRDDWKQAYDDLVAESTPDAPEEPG